MNLAVTGVIFDRNLAESLTEGQTKAFPLGKGEKDAVAVFGIENGKATWAAANKDAFVHVDGGPVSERMGELGAHSVRIGSWNNRENHVTAKEVK